MRTHSTIPGGRLRRAVGLAALAACAIAPEAAAQYTLRWYTIDGGGRNVTSGGSYSLSSTIGQPDAGRHLSGGSYSLTGGFWVGNASVVAVEDEGEPDLGLPARFHMYAPAPNPTLHRTTIAFDMPSERAVRLRVHDAAGRLVRTLADGLFAAGRHRLTWDGADDGGRPAPTGIYFVRFEAGAASVRHKVALIR